jgi:hypothetical protein
VSNSSSSSFVIARDTVGSEIFDKLVKDLDDDAIIKLSSNYLVAWEDSFRYTKNM